MFHDSNNHVLQRSTEHTFICRFHRERKILPLTHMLQNLIWYR